MAVGDIHPDAKFHDAVGWYVSLGAGNPDAMPGLVMPDQHPEARWADKPDQFSDRVRASHPVMSKVEDRHARFALAMEMIHSRHSKYALVELVNWLLEKWPELQSEAKR